METGGSIVVYEKSMVRKESKVKEVSEVRGEMTIYNLNAIQSTLKSPGRARGEGKRNLPGVLLEMLIHPQELCQANISGTS